MIQITFTEHDLNPIPIGRLDAIASPEFAGENRGGTGAEGIR
jgi:hypothetical protein